MASPIEEEYETYNQNRQWKIVYDHIRNKATILHNLTSTDARLPLNRDRNRYRDVSPYDNHRVRLEGCDNDYINASLVQVPSVSRTYILTQGPLSHTSGHFWLMVWQQKSKGVLMLNRIIEDGRLKCDLYFPSGKVYGGDDSLTFKDVMLKVELVGLEESGCYVKRYLRLIHTETLEEKEVIQFQYTSWPDFGIPSDSESFLSFLYAVRESGVIPPTNSSSEQGPPVIHCSAGIGRSGTFCLVDSALVLVEREESLHSLNVCSMLLDMRQYRCGLIQTADQLRFSYMAILDGARSYLSSHTAQESSSPDSVANDLSASVSTEDENEIGTDSDTHDNPTPSTGGEIDGPEPPVRTSSLSADGQTDETVANAESNNLKTEKRHTMIPEPPKRTSSLHKAASVDQPSPPPVPPRPPSNLERQLSAPAVPESVSTEPNNPAGEEDGYSNVSSSRMKQMRDEKRKRTQELVDTIKTKQQKAERRQQIMSVFKSNWVWLGAALSLAAAVGVAYYWHYN